MIKGHFQGRGVCIVLSSIDCCEKFSCSEKTAPSLVVNYFTVSCRVIGPVVA